MEKSIQRGTFIPLYKAAATTFYQAVASGGYRYFNKLRIKGTSSDYR
ncbi:hypothetical protein [Granulicella sp. S156]|nr:hypothetical protein [Granulicella sp. S156]